VGQGICFILKLYKADDKKEEEKKTASMQKEKSVEVTVTRASEC
jgi:hypothetical protein